MKNEEITKMVFLFNFMFINCFQNEVTKNSFEKFSSFVLKSLQSQPESNHLSKRKGEKNDGLAYIKLLK